MFTKEQEIFIIENYNKIGPSKIAKILNTNRNYIYKFAKSKNILIENLFKKIKFNESLFKFNKYKNLLNLNDKHSCYMLGFIWADGHLADKHKNRKILNLTISYKDYNNISDVFSLSCKYNFKEKTIIRNNKSFKYAVFTINNIILHEKLKEYNFHKKSYVFPEKLLKDIPKNNIKYFIHGFFDGDGHVKYNKKGMYGLNIAFDSRCDIDSWIDFFKSFDLNFSKYIKKKGNSASIVISNRASCQLFYEKFIKNNNFGLKRKNDKFIQIETAPIGYKPNRSTKKAYQFDKNFNLIKVWETTKDVAEFYKCTTGRIIRSMTYGYYCNNSYWGRKEIFEKEEKFKRKSIKDKANKLNKKNNKNPG